MKGFEFEKRDWDSFHDIILEATWETSKLDLNEDELKKLFEELPEYLKKDVYHWGMSDTVVGDNIYVWYRKEKLQK
jgi:hypothetical protein